MDEINKTAQYLLDDAAFGPREGNKVVTGLYDTLPVPENDGSWSAVERPKWTFVHKDRPMNCDQFVRRSPTQPFMRSTLSPLVLCAVESAFDRFPLARVQRAAPGYIRQAWRSHGRGPTSDPQELASE